MKKHYMVGRQFQLVAVLLAAYKQNEKEMTAT